MNPSPVVLRRVVFVVAVLGAFLPWAVLGPARVTGTSTTEGMIVLICAGIGLLLTFSPGTDPKARQFEFVIAGAAALSSGWFYLDNFRGEEFADPGYGLYLCIPTTVAWLCWLLWDLRGSKRYRRNRPPRRLDDWG